MGKKHLGVWCALLFLMMPNAGQATSLDCSQAVAPIALTICSDKFLPEAYDENAKEWEIARGIKVIDGQKTSEDTQRAWMADVAVQCHLPQSGLPDPDRLALAQNCVRKALNGKAEELDMLVEESLEDEHTIRLSDYPKDAPRPEDYRVPVYKGPFAAAKLVTPLDHTFRTMIRGGGREPPNFAGHYVLAMWGCGAACTSITFINTITGKVIMTDDLFSVVADNNGDMSLDKAMNQMMKEGYGPVWFQPNSELLVAIGTPNEDNTLHGISFFVMHNDHLKRIRFVPK